LSSNQHKKALVFFSAGVGDAILLVPLVNELKKQGYAVTGLFTSPFGCESIFENTHLFDDVKIRKNKLAFVLFSIVNFRKYDAVFVNHFSFSKSHLTLAAFLGKDVYTNYKEFTSAQSSPAIHFIDPQPNTHDALQNVFLINASVNLSDLNFNLNYTSQKTNFDLPKKFIVIQPSSANNKAPYKSWDIEKWLELFKHLQTKSPDTTLVLLGDNTELYLNGKINSSNHPNVLSLIGKTTLNDAMEIIHQSQFYIGLDSGLMHMAVALNKPTFTVWGASNPTLYGYKWLGEKHKIVSLNLACAPCSAWINPNRSRVSNPLLCPDFKCLANLSLDTVKEELIVFLNKIC
jgi:ADP-heptose:LPS heptosyltransferase